MQHCPGHKPIVIVVLPGPNTVLVRTYVPIYCTCIHKYTCIFLGSFCFVCVLQTECHWYLALAYQLNGVNINMPVSNM